MAKRPISSFIGTLFVLISLLFTQLAVAAHACPVMTLSGQSSMQGMNDCTSMDMPQPVLCHEHAQGNNTKFYQSDFPSVQPFIPATLSLVIAILNEPGYLVKIQSAPDRLTRSTSPPLSIQYCCFRN